MSPLVHDGLGIQLRCIPARDYAFADRARMVIERNIASGEVDLDLVISRSESELRGEFPLLTLHLQDELAVLGPRVLYAYRDGDGQTPTSSTPE